MKSNMVPQVMTPCGRCWLPSASGDCLSRSARRGAPPGVVLALLLVTYSFVVRTVQPVLMELDKAQEEAAYTIGASKWTTFRTVVLPTITPAIITGSLLTFARALGEFGAVLVVSGGVSGLTETSTLFIFRSLDDRNYVAAYSTAAVLAAISFVVLVCMELFRKRSHRT